MGRAWEKTANSKSQLHAHMTIRFAHPFTYPDFWNFPRGCFAEKSGFWAAADWCCCWWVVSEAVSQAEGGGKLKGFPQLAGTAQGFLAAVTSLVKRHQTPARSRDSDLHIH